MNRDAIDAGRKPGITSDEHKKLVESRRPVFDAWLGQFDSGAGAGAGAGTRWRKFLRELGNP